MIRRRKALLLADAALDAAEPRDGLGYWSACPGCEVFVQHRSPRAVLHYGVAWHTWCLVKARAARSCLRT